MKRLLPFLLAVPLSAQAGTTTLVAVPTTATKMPATHVSTRRAVLVENLGPNPIWCSYSSATLAAGAGHKLATGEAREFPSDILWCLAETASQTGAANNVTVVSEV